MVTAIGEGFRGPDGRVGYLLRQANQAFRAAAQADLAPLGLTFPQYSVLSVADAEPGLSGAELARDSMLTPQTTNEIISLLVRRACWNAARTMVTGGCGGCSSPRPGATCCPGPGRPCTRSSGA